MPCAHLACFLQHHATLDIHCWWPLPTHKRLIHINSIGTVERCGYNVQQIYTICDACRPCHSIWNTVRAVFHQIRQICCASKSLRCLDVEIWQFFYDDRTDYFTPCACTRGKYVYLLTPLKISIFLYKQINKIRNNLYPIYSWCSAPFTIILLTVSSMRWGFALEYFHYVKQHAWRSACINCCSSTLPTKRNWKMCLKLGQNIDDTNLYIAYLCHNIIIRQVWTIPKESTDSNRSHIPNNIWIWSATMVAASGSH